MRKMTSTIAQLFLSYKDRALIFQTSQQEKVSLPGYNNPRLIQEYVLISKIGIFTLVQNCLPEQQRRRVEEYCWFSPIM